MQFIKKHALFNVQDKLLVATSGGVDSIVMCHLLKQANFQFSIAHCNFQLRGEASNKDEEFVKSYGEELGVEVFTTRFETEKYAKANKASTQMAARDLRYSWFEELKHKHDFTHLLTAHHLNDHVETLLLGIARGGGIKSITGVPVKKGWVARPLLAFTKNDVLTYAAKEQIDWREDASNVSIKYKRNFVRHELVPKFEALNPSFLETASKLMERTNAVAKVYQKHIENLRENLLKTDGEALSVSIEVLKEAEVSATEMSDVFAEFGFTYDQCEDLLSNLDGLSGRIFKSATHELLIDRSELLIKPKSAVAFELVQIDTNESEVYLNANYEITKESIESLPLDKNPDNAQLDFDKLSFPLKARKWEEGDKFTPLGMKGQKLVSDLLIDEKVSVFDKAHVLVMLSGDEIAWVVGYRISDKFKRDVGTEQVLYFRKVQG